MCVCLCMCVCECVSLLGLCNTRWLTGLLTEMCFLTFLEVRSPRTRCGQSWFLPRRLSLLRRRHLLPCPPVAVPPCDTVSSSYQDTGEIGSGPTHKTSFTLITSWRHPTPDCEILTLLKASDDGQMLVLVGGALPRLLGKQLASGHLPLFLGPASFPLQLHL